jgi:hypothetical protein
MLMDLTEEEEFEFRARAEQEEGLATSEDSVTSAPESEWRKNAREMEGREWYDPKDAAVNVGGYVREGLAGAADLPVNMSRIATEAIDQTTGTNLSQYPKAGQEWLDRQVADARSEAGRDPEEWSGARTIGKIGAEIALTRKIPFLNPSVTVAGRFTRILNLVKQGTGVGVIEGSTNYKPEVEEPYSFPDLAEKSAIGAGTGVVATAAGSLIQPTVRYAKEAIKHTKNTFAGVGSEGRLVNKTIGVESKRDIIRELEKASNNNPNRPMTAGEATARVKSTEFAALQKASDDIIPSKALKVTEATDGLNERAIRAIVGEGSEVAIKKRKVESNPFYAKVKSSEKPVITAPVVSKLKELIDDSELYTFVSNPLRDILKQLDVDDVRKLNVRKLHGMSKQIQHQIGESKEGIPTYDKATLMEVKDLLDTQISKVSKDYKVATDLWRKNSVAVNKAQLGEDLIGAYRMSLDDLPARKLAFANLVNKYKAKTHPKTGKPMLDALSPEQTKSLGEVLDHMSRQLKMDKMAKLGRKSETIKSAPPEISPPGFFNPFITVLRGHLNRKLKNVDRETKERLANLMVSGDNKALAKLIKEDLGQEELKQVGDFITYNLDPIISTYVPAIAAGGATGDERVRKLINRNK